MIADAIVFNNEILVLETRMATLDPIVDKFVVVEAELTQSLLPKPLHFSLNQARFERFKDKIIHIVVKAEECPDNSIHSWEMENFQRDCISRGLEQCGLADEDIVLISDCDEIPHPGVLERTVFGPGGGRNIILDHPIAFEGSFHAYYLDLHAPDKGWVGTVALPRHLMSRMSPQAVRDNKDFFDRVEGAWHFSYCAGGWKGVFDKYRATIEPISKDCLIKEESEFKAFFGQRVLKDKRFIYMDRRDDMSVKLDLFHRDKLPECVQGDTEKYAELLFPQGE